MILVEHLSIKSGSFALHDVNFCIPRGQYAVLMGKTGSGKTTILEAICGLRPVVGGRICLMDLDVTHLKPAQRGIGYVPQDRALFSTMTVRQHLAFALRVRGWTTTAVYARVAELAEWLGLCHLLDRLPAGLSGGEAQRVALGRALAFGPEVLLLDEPLSALDDDTRQEMYEVLRSVRQRTAVTALHVTHNRRDAEELASQVLYLENGTIRTLNGLVAPSNMATCK